MEVFISTLPVWGPGQIRTPRKAKIYTLFSSHTLSNIKRWLPRQRGTELPFIINSGETTFPFLSPLLQDLCSLYQADELHLHGLIPVCLMLSSPCRAHDTLGHTHPPLNSDLRSCNNNDVIRGSPSGYTLLSHVLTLSPTCVQMRQPSCPFTASTITEIHTHTLCKHMAWHPGGGKPRRSHCGAVVITSFCLFLRFKRSSSITQHEKQQLWKETIFIHNLE